jgi:hypothetical protein
MDWYRDVEREGPVVKHIDSKEKKCAVGPFTHWDRGVFEIVFPIDVELITQAEHSSENELEQRDQ